MRNKYSRQLQQHHQQQRSTFLPMLCSSSTKEVKVSHRRCTSSSSSVSEEPSSPKVGCMGQVKRNNKVVGFPTIIGFIGTNTTNNNHATNNSTIFKNEHNSTTTNSTISIVKYHKLKKFFSSKSLTSSPTTTATRTARGGTHKPKNSARIVAGVDHMHQGRSTICRSKTDEHKNSSSHINSQKVSIVNLEELDPPLPVMKRVQKQEQEEGSKGENLWKRRSGGAPLRSLQVQVIHQNHSLLPPPASTA